ncbi:MAG: helix-turn-helix domain-containing protein [Candidatus Saccharimonadia bacterium]
MVEKSQNQPSGVGATLKKRRQTLKLSLTSVELATKIRGKYLVAIEADDYSALPNDIYSRGFITKYADYLGLDANELTDNYSQQRGGFDSDALVGAPKPVRGRTLVVTPRIVVAGSFLVVVAAVVAYLVWQFSALAAAPRLSVDSPASDLVVEGSTINVAGHVAGGADVFINNSPILSDANGAFSNTLALSNGLNVITITAENKLSKTTTITRNILAHLPSVNGQPLVPTSVITGVDIAVSAKNSAINITTKIDNGAPSSITILPGASLGFSASSTISLTTSNAASTDVVITNTQVAGKDLGNVGKTDTKMQLDFSADTAFP